MKSAIVKLSWATWLIAILGCETLFGPDEATDQFIQGQEDLGPGAIEIEHVAHPKKPTAWHTRMLLLRHENLDASHLKKCQDELGELIQSTNTQQGFLEARLSILPAVQASPGPYHWCFYHTMRELDFALEKANMPLTKKATVFFREMKKLWILGRALDTSNEISEADLYFDYLRQRYVDISTQIFGRTIEVVGDSLDTHFRRRTKSTDSSPTESSDAENPPENPSPAEQWE